MGFLTQFRDLITQLDRAADELQQQCCADG